jgi:hypothetical protein
MNLDIEKSQLLFKLVRNHTWNNIYDRLEHFKRFQNLDLIIKELSNIGWIIFHKKKFKAISLNTRYKKGIIEFIEFHLPYLKGVIK